MNTKRIIFWASFIIILGLIVWGLVVAMNKAPAAPKGVGTPADVTMADNVRGPMDAPVTLIEYSDFQCPACAAYYPLVERLFSESSTTLRFVYRHYPLPQHKNADLAARAAEAANSQGKFWEMSQQIFENQTSWSELGDARARQIFAGYAASLGLNMEKYSTDLESAGTKQKVRDQYREGVAIGINSTPTFFVNGKTITNPRNYDEFKKIIDDALKGGTQ